MADKDARAMFKALTNTLGIPKELVRYWNEHHPKKTDDLRHATELLVAVQFPVTELKATLEDWMTTDWRGKQGTLPTGGQLAEHGIQRRNTIQRVQTTLEDLDVKRPRWKGAYDTLRARFISYEQAYVTAPKQWADLAKQFHAQGRPDAAAQCVAKTEPTDQINYLTYKEVSDVN